MSETSRKFRPLRSGGGRFHIWQWHWVLARSNYGQQTGSKASIRSFRDSITFDVVAGYGLTTEG